ncbi:MAG: hypothetical protein WAT66_16640 [Actinomycetota bacterium]
MPPQQPLVVGSDIRNNGWLYVDEGDDPKGRPLRRVLLRAGFLLLTLALAACSSGTTTGGTPQTSASESVKVQVYRLGARATTAKGTVIVFAYDASVAPTNSATPEAGKKFVAIDAEGCAGENADEATGIDPLLFYLQYKADPYYPLNQGVKEPVLHQTALASGRCARGWITFEIPEDLKPQYAFFRTTGRVAWLLTS